MKKTLSYYLNHKYFRQFNWYLFSGLMLFGAQFLMTSYIAKHNTLEDYSLYSFALSICTPIFLFFNMNSRVLIASNSDTHRFVDWRNYRILTLVIALAISLGLGYSILGPTGLALIAVLAGFRLMDGLYEWTYGFYVGSEQGDRVGRSQIFRSLALLLPICLGLTVMTNISIVEIYIFILVALVVVFIGVDWKHLRNEYASNIIENN